MLLLFIAVNETLCVNEALLRIDLERRGVSFS